MSTNNFSYDNILVVCPDFVNEFDYNIYVKEMREQIYKIDKVNYRDEDRRDNDRNYPGQVIASISIEDTTHYNMGTIYIEIVIKSGHYMGNNIDYTIDGDFVCSEDEESNKNIQKHYNALHKKVAKKCERIKKVLQKYGGKEYTKVGQFSNGEAVYQIKK